MTTRPPMQSGDHVYVEGVRSRDLNDETLHNVVAEVLRVDDQNCGCWRITCVRPGSGAGSGTFQVYAADCHWPHTDRIDYAAALAAADSAQHAELELS